MADFGLAKAVSKTSVVGTHTIKSGTPGFQAPEQLMGTCTCPISCDVYAMGGVITETFTSRQLWPSLSPYQIIYKVTIEKIMPDITGVPEELKSTVVKCFAPFDERLSSIQLLNLIGHTL